MKSYKRTVNPTHDSVHPVQIKLKKREIDQPLRKALSNQSNGSVKSVDGRGMKVKHLNLFSNILFLNSHVLASLN